MKFMPSIKTRLILLGLAPLAAQGKYQVCSITINSSDEIKAFREYLPEEHFEFVELVPQVKGEHYKKHDSHWFYKSCGDQKYNCDIVVISGHFGGAFFGEAGYTLPTQMLEEQSCNNSCGGILSRAKEVFLFGCNTLASKKPDTRTYQDYLNVLLEDGMAREMAERVAAARYSPLGDSYKNRMKFTFSGSQTIYGFEMLSPLGKHMSPLLKKYLQSVNKQYGNYHNYINQEGYLKDQNPLLFPHVPHTTMAQADTILDELSHQTFARKCLLYNEQAPFPERVQALRELFQTDSALKSFFAIDYFWDKHEARILEGKQRKFFHGLRKNKPLADGFREAYGELNFLPYIQIGFLNFLRKFNWVDSNFFDRELKRAALHLIKTPDSEAYEAILLLRSRNHIQPGYLYFSEEDLSQGYVSNLWSLLIFEKLRVDAVGLMSDVYLLCQKMINSDPVICYQALNTLAHGKPTEDMAGKMLPLLRHPDTGIIYYSLRVIGQSGLTDYEIHEAVAEFLSNDDPWLRQEALDSLGFLKTPYQNIQEKIADNLTRGDKKEALEILKTFGKLNIQSEAAMISIMEYVNSQPQDENIAKGGVIAFKNTEFIPDFVLDHFYYLLELDDPMESDDQKKILWMIKMISKMPVKDFGVDHRLAQIAQTSNITMKREVLKKLSGRTWFHPEAQEEMIPLLTNSDRKNRELAVDLFRNVENWTKQTKDRVKSLSANNDQIKELAEEFTETTN